MVGPPHTFPKNKSQKFTRVFTYISVVTFEINLYTEVNLKGDGVNLRTSVPHYRSKVLPGVTRDGGP